MAESLIQYKIKLEILSSRRSYPISVGEIIVKYTGVRPQDLHVAMADLWKESHPRLKDDDDKELRPPYHHPPPRSLHAGSYTHTHTHTASRLIE